MPIMSIEKETSSKLNLGSPDSMMKYNLFENNESRIKIAKAPILTLRTKHIALEHHHFRSRVEDGSISIEAIRTDEKNADTLTKPVGDPQFTCLRKKVQRTLILRGSFACRDLKQDSIVFPDHSLTSHALSIIRSHFIRSIIFLSNCQSFEQCYLR